MFGSKNILGLKNVRSKKYWIKKILCPYKFLAQKVDIKKNVMRALDKQKSSGFKKFCAEENGVSRKIGAATK